ncbi:MAG: hypothetical protein CSA26_08125 [Desulfobacterales bacterium]|nr:MAG: hypothetical protein CSA26_08125 [Desulfobacterales bacterium]
MKILLIKLGALGDVINTFPLVVNLKKQRDVEIDWLVAPLSYPLVASHPCVDNAILFDRKRLKQSLPHALREIRKKKYDITLDLQRILKSSLFAQASRSVRRIGFNKERCKEQTWLFPFDRIPASDPQAHMLLQYFEFLAYMGVPEREVSWMIPRNQNNLPPGLPKNYIVLNIGASRAVKIWPPDHFAVLADLVEKKYNLQSVLTGGPDDLQLSKIICGKANADIVDLTGKTSIPQLVEVIAGAICVVTGDTGAMHLASALGTELVALFGPTNPRRTGPFYGSVIQKSELSCVPCNKRTCNDHLCMKAITAEDVFLELESLLRRIGTNQNSK